MPEDAPAGKLAATRGYGAEVIALRPLRRATARRCSPSWSPSAGSSPIHPYDDPRVMAGQGTAALELLEEAGPLDVAARLPSAAAG